MQNGEVVIHDWRDFTEPRLPSVLEAALSAFVEQGYHGTSIRTVAARASLSVPGIYHHYPSKQDLLVSIVDFAMDDLLARSRQALAAAGRSTEMRFKLLVECLVLFHAHRGDMAFVAASEIRSLSQSARSDHIARRDKQQRLLDQVIEEGVADGTFTTADARFTSRSIVTICTAVAQWYKLGGRLTPEELAFDYWNLCRAALDK